MTPASAAAIGRTLSRLGRAHSAAGEAVASAAEVGSSREAVFAAIKQSQTAIGIDAICAHTGLHANTVRPHLDVLLAAGRIERERGPSSGRGRPPWLYRRLATPEDRKRDELEAALVGQLQDANTPELAAAAANRWAAQLDPQHRHGPARTPDEAVAAAGDSLASLGFEVSITPTGDRIDLRGCPYRDLVAERPVICDIHAALLQQLLDASGQPVTLETLDVWRAPGVCTAHLRRTDQQPFRSITMRSPE